MLTVTEIAGFAGAGLAGAAYIPQISHLIRARAIAILAGVYIVLGGIQIVATALIMVCAARYRDRPCPVHLPGEPAARTAIGTDSPGNEPGSRRRAGRPAAASATPAGHGRARRGYVPVMHRHGHAVTESQTTHLEGTT